MRRTWVSALFGVVITASTGLGQNAPASQCAPDNAGLKLPTGFCAGIFADSLRGARHMWVASNGDVWVSQQTGRDAGGVWILRDANRDGKAETRVKFASGFNSSEVMMFDGYIYAENHAGVLRFPYKPGSLDTAASRETVVQDLPSGGDHFTKTFAIDKDGTLYVDIGSPSNACQDKNRAKESPGKMPCAELDTRAGIWKWDARKLNQTYATGTRFATGLRNGVGIEISPLDGKLWSTQHGRDQLGGEATGGNWPNSVEYNAENPAEELLQVNQGDDFGWPYCYYSVEEHRLVLAPEYGGDTKKPGECANKKEPVAAYPAHWAPNALWFYTGSAFPAKYRNGAFIAFHGSWNRAPENQAGFNVVFQPLKGEAAAGSYEVFADGFASDKSPNARGNHRPTGFAQGPDGALYVADDALGRIYKIIYTGK